MDDLKAGQDQIDLLNQEAWDTRVNDSVRAGIISAESISKSRRINYRKGLAEGLRTLGFSLLRQSRHDEALQCLKEAMDIFVDLKNDIGQSEVYGYFGIISRSKGDLKSSLEYLYMSHRLMLEAGYGEGVPLALYHLGVTYRYLGNLEKALDFFLQSLELAKKNEDWMAESYSINHIGTIYLEMGDLENALLFIQQSLSIRESQGDQWGAAGCLDNIGRIYFLMKDYGNAREQFSKAMAISTSVSDKKGEGNALLHLAELDLALDNSTQANEFANKCLTLRTEIGDKKGQAEALLLMIDLSAEKDKLPLIERAVEMSDSTGSLDLKYKIHGKYYAYYKKHQRFENALRHLEAFHQTEKELHSQSLAQKIANLQLSHQVEQSQKESEIFRLKNIELANALEDLKVTQRQLIQSEKMASLGELAAGIAHEIQNPLNFVNNFSELNKELIDEFTLAHEFDNAIELKELFITLKRNEDKISHHGQRADSIVKGMLQHSRESKGLKELTDLNALINEYLQLSYQGQLAKDPRDSASKSLQIKLDTHFDQNLGMINIVPQDIGRVILNLFNNAYYAVSEKKKLQRAELPDYDPIITVSTKRLDNRIEIRVKDNGIGIPSKLLEKIFQPFFTTKPTGQGTGLGLSLSYDIIKAHGGEIMVKSKEGEGAEFIIQVPIA